MRLACQRRRSAFLDDMHRYQMVVQDHIKATFSGSELKRNLTRIVRFPDTARPCSLLNDCFQLCLWPPFLLRPRELHQRTYASIDLPISVELVDFQAGIENERCA
jgi:hypothetical protein